MAKTYIEVNLVPKCCGRGICDVGKFRKSLVDRLLQECVSFVEIFIPEYVFYSFALANGQTIVGD